MELEVRGAHISASSSPVLVSSERSRIVSCLGEEVSTTCSGREESGQSLVSIPQQLTSAVLRRRQTQGFASETDLDRLPPLRNFQTLSLFSV